MKILVTGSAGFIGKNLVESLKNIRDGKDRTRPDLMVQGEVHMGGIMKKWLLLTFVIMSCLCFCSCGTSDKEGAKETVATFLEGYKQCDETISSMLLGAAGSDSMTFEGISVYFAEKLEYEIVSCKSSGEDIYKVKVILKTIDFGQLFEKTYDELVKNYGEEESESYFMSVIEDIIHNDGYDTYETECEVIVRKANNGFKIQLDSDLANGLTGGMNAYLNSLVGGE